MPLPIPRLAPVTIATLPSNRPLMRLPTRSPVRCATVSWNPLRRHRFPGADGADDGHGPVDRVDGRRRSPRSDVHAGRIRADSRVGRGSLRSPRRAGELAPRADVEGAERERQVECVARAPYSVPPTRSDSGTPRLPRASCAARQLLVGDVQLEVGDRFDHVVARGAERAAARTTSSSDAEVGGLAQRGTAPRCRAGARAPGRGTAPSRARSSR